MATEAPIVPNLDKKWFKGADVRLRWILNPVPAGGIAGWTIKFGMAKTKGGIVLLPKTCTIEDPTAAICYADIADTDTDDLDATTYFYELKRMDAGNEAILAYGSAQLLEVVGVT